MLPIKPVAAPLYVITSVSNPMRYQSRYHLYRQFEKYVEDSGAVLYTAELRLRNRDFEVTTAGHAKHLQLTTTSEIWHKENLLNLLLARLPPDWQYVAWLDADIKFARPDWVDETLHLLQHYDVVQLFSQASDLTPDHRMLNQRDGFVYWWMTHQRGPVKRKYQGGNIPHPGYAWAARRDALTSVGGLLDFGIVGSADWHMACGLVDQVEHSLYPQLYQNCPTYVKWCQEWAARAKQNIRQNVGFMEGLCYHFWHGPKAKRAYYDRWKILTQNKFDPTLDLARDWQGVWQLTKRNVKLRDQLRAYFASRDEDQMEM